MNNVEIDPPYQDRDKWLQAAVETAWARVQPARISFKYANGVSLTFYSNASLRNTETDFRAYFSKLLDEQTWSEESNENL